MPFSPNILTNPDFETGDLTGWASTGSPETLEVVTRAGSYQAHVIESSAEQSGFKQDYTAPDQTFMVMDFDYEVLSGSLLAHVNGGSEGQTGIVYPVGSGVGVVTQLAGTGGLEVLFRSNNIAAEFYIDNVRLRRQSMAIATNIALTVRDGKGALSNPSVHILSSTILDDIVEYAQEFATVMDGIMTGEIIAISATVRVALPGGLGSAAANSDVEEGAMFLVDCVGGVKSRLRVPTFDEAKMIAGSKLVDMTDAEVILLVAHLEDGFTTTTPTDVDTLEYREADMELVTAGYDAFQKSR